MLKASHCLSGAKKTSLAFVAAGGTNGLSTKPASVPSGTTLTLSHLKPTAAKSVGSGIHIFVPPQTK